ncbi:MAG TPA: sigma-70 family RNA polymerase sigma factor [Clostridia bacterium]|nr:sigma-70 family RNA polymerase sigma factor [Clostridia bacterium]
MEDSKIIDLYWSRNEQAITETQTKYGALCYSIAINILYDALDSEECVNDTYNKAWQSIPPKHPNSLAAYLGRIARNLSINRWNKNHAQKRFGGTDILLSELSQCIPSRQTVEGEIQSKEITKVLDCWLRSLPQEDRILFLRRYWFCEALNALADECNITPNKLAGRMYRLRQSLRRELEKEDVWI